ncbi:amino acid adenylation domain-containing protein [Streptomyces sp. NPDC057654]|uniref:amino acid adenylation domain-containing protein n=1 Tax=Streptomyces sp. NPDC057654 TaxID=3346196 RepID=UPI00368FAEF4
MRTTPPGYDRTRHGVHLLQSADVIADPTRYINAITELGPLFFDEVGSVWVCSGYAEAVEILRDHERFSSVREHTPHALRARGLHASAHLSAMVHEQMLFLDPPRHHAIRSALAGQFSGPRVKSREDDLRSIVTSTLHTLPEQGAFDLVEDYAAKLPSALVAYLFAMPGREAELTRWAEAYERFLGSLAALPAAPDAEVDQTLAQALNALEQEARHRIGHPGDDVISALTAPLADRTPTEEEVLAVAANGIVLVGGGYQTLTHLVTSALLALHHDPERRRRVRQDPALLADVVTETMRVNGSSQFVARRATADTTVHGTPITAGDSVLVHLAAANLDPRTFTDPGTLDPDRHGPRHLGFGAGRHTCPGAGYAERLACYALEGFLAKYPFYAPEDGPSALVWGLHGNTRCLQHAKVRVSPHTPDGTESERPGHIESERPGHLETERPDGTETARSDHTECDKPDHTECDKPDHTETERRDAPVPTTRPLDAAPASPQRQTPTTPQRPATAACWHEAFEQQARTTPDAPAVQGPHETLTYRELDERANALAYRLRRQGARPGTVAAVVMERSAEFVLAVLAVAKTGAAFLLADVSCPRERLRTMLVEAEARLVISDHSVPAAAFPAQVTATGDGARHPDAPLTGATAGDTAYVVFTSGTTATPKAIAISHEATVNLHLAQQEIFHQGPGDRVLQFLSPNFDGCVADLTLALLSGATLVVAPSEDLIVGPPLTRLLAAQKITIVILTPSVWMALPDEPLPDLRIAASAGERLPAAWARRWSRPGRRLLNLYGPAETAVLATWHECSPAEERPPIGRPVANKHAYLLDDALRRVPAGQEGELWIGGTGVGRYLNQPDLMEKHFARDPHTSTAEPLSLLYRTGDICRTRPDGTLDYISRRDRQVKFHGQRVELDEIERVLETAPGVAACHVHPQDDRLEALIVPTGPHLDEEPISTHLNARLHSAMVPTTFTQVTELPRSINGKSTHNGAAPDPPPDTTPPAPVTGPEADERRRSHLTWKIAQEFAHTLDLPLRDIGTASDFFGIGGDSIKLAAFLARMEALAGAPVDTAALITAPTPAKIADLLLTAGIPS